MGNVQCIVYWRVREVKGETGIGDCTMYCVLKGKRSLRETDIEECTMYCVLKGKRSLRGDRY